MQRMLVETSDFDFASGMERKEKIARIVVAVLFLALIDVFISIFSMTFGASMDDSGGLLFALMFGSIAGQVATLATIATLVSGPKFSRFFWSAMGLIGVWYLVSLGSLIVQVMNVELANRIRNLFDIYLAAVVGSLLATGFIVCCTATWTAQSVKGWRIERADFKSNENSNAQFQMRQLFVWTAAIAVVLGAGRIVLPPGDWTSIQVHFEILFPYAFLSIAAALMQLAVIPTVLGKYRLNSDMILRLFGIAVVSAIIEFCLICCMVGGLFNASFPPVEYVVWFMGILFFVSVGHVSTSATCLYILRSLGYELISRPYSLYEHENEN